MSSEGKGKGMVDGIRRYSLEIAEVGDHECELFLMTHFTLAALSVKNYACILYLYDIVMLISMMHSNIIS